MTPDSSRTQTRFRAAVIGAGAMGRHHARLFAENPRTDMVAIVDPDGARAAAEAAPYQVPTYPTLSALLDREQIDLVAIAAPTSFHHEVGLAALRHGLHVLMEKPIAATTQEALELAVEAHRAGVVLAVGHVERFNPALRKLKQLVDDAAIGKTTSIVTRRLGVMPPRIKDANIVIDLAIHDIDICSYLMGSQPESVVATAGSAHLSDRFDYTEIFLNYRGTGCFVQASWITPVKVRKLAITGTHGYAELDYLTQELTLFRDGEWPEHNTFGEMLERGTAKPELVEVPKSEPLAEQLEAFLGTIDGERTETVSAVEAVAALAVAERALVSAEGTRKPTATVVA
jgi:UDP-N-acetylglucosamine 3-dehydrogenase